MTGLRLEVPLTHDPEAVMGAVDLISQAADEVALRFEADVGQCEFSRAADGVWTPDGDVDILPGLTLQEGAEGYTSEALLDTWSNATGSVAVTASATTGKQQWANEIGSAARATVWLGPHLEGFGKWLDNSSAVNVLSSLLTNAPALVLLGDWSEPPCRLGAALTIAGLDDPPSVASATAPLREWPTPAPEWALRGLDVELSGAPDRLRPRLAGILGWAASRLLAARSGDDVVHPDSHSPTSWTVLPHAQAEPTDIEAVRALCHWISREPNRTRLLVAQRTAAARIADPLNGPPDTSVVDAAEISYEQLVSETVQDGLAKQIELERSFREMDSQMATIRSSLTATLDQTLLRALAGMLAIAAAAFAIEKPTSGLVWAGTVLVVAYLLSVVFFQLRFSRAEVADRLTAFRQLLRARGFGLGTAAAETSNAWENNLKRRIGWIRLGLLALCVVILTVAAVWTR